MQLLGGRSYLFGGEITADILQENNVEAVDLLTVDMGEVGIKELRQVIAQALQRPFGEKRLLHLQNMQSPTDIIQDTLLKILEEPPATLIIVVQAANPEELLPTVRSRLHTVGNQQTAAVTVESTIPASKSAADSYLRTIKERVELVGLFTNELLAIKQEFLRQPSTLLSARMQQLSNAITRLKQNCNQKIVIDAFLLHWFDSSGKA